MIKAIIFDLDGTLVTFNLDIKACRTKIIHYLKKQGIPSSLFSLNETAFDMLKIVKKYFKSKGMENQNFVKIEKIVLSIVERFELKAAQTNKIFPEIYETLKTLRDMGLKIALCTISGEKVTKFILERFNIESFFDAVFPRESVLEVKPDPLHLQAALSALEVKSNEAVLVGDSVKDIVAATHLNIIAIGVTTGLSSFEELTLSGAHYIASSIIFIPNLILHLNKQAKSECN